MKKNILIQLCVLLLLVTIPSITQAQVTISNWTGDGATSNWSEQFNWSGAEVPPGGAMNDLIFADPALDPDPIQDLGAPFKIGGMFVLSDSDSFNFSGSGIDIDGTNGGNLEIDGSNTTFMSNDLIFSNDSGLLLSNGAFFNFSGSSISQAGQSSGTTLVSGDGSLFFTGLTDLPAHLQIESGVTTIFSMGPNPVVVANGFDAAGNVSMGNSNMIFGSGGTIDGNLNVGFSAIIGTTGKRSLDVNGTTFVAGESFLRIEDDSNFGGAGSVQVTLGGMSVGTNAVVAKDVFVEESSIFGDADSSMVTGAVELGNFAVIGGNLQLASTLTVTGTQQADLLKGAFVQAVGQTTVNSGAALGINDSSELYGAGDLVVQTNGTINLQNGTIRKDVFLDQGAMVTGDGNIVGMLSVDGLIGPGNSAGTLGIDGDVVMTDTTETCIELGGTDAGRFDLINGMAGFDDGVNTAFLDGELIVSLIDDHVPSLDDEYVFIQNFNVMGTFDNTGGDAFTTGSLSVNGGGIIQIEYGTNFVRLYGFRAVPEPGTGTLLALLSVAALAKRRRRGSSSRFYSSS